MRLSFVFLGKIFVFLFVFWVFLVYYVNKILSWYLVSRGRKVCCVVELEEVEIEREGVDLKII